MHSLTGDSDTPLRQISTSNPKPDTDPNPNPYPSPTSHLRGFSISFVGLIKVALLSGDPHINSTLFAKLSRLLGIWKRDAKI